MADRKNKRSNLGVGVGSAAHNTDSAYYHDNSDGTYDESVGSHVYVKIGGQWVAWDGVNVARAPLTASSPAAAAVGVASAQVVASNTSRTGLVLVNTSTAYISLGIGTAAVLYSGITLNPAGGTFEMDSFMFFTGAVTAIASAAASNLSIQEFT